MEKIKVVIVDSSESMIQRLHGVIRKDKEIEIVAAAQNAEEGYCRIKEYKPDVVILDLIIPKQKGLLMMERIQKDEELLQSPKFIILSFEREDEIVQHAFQLGADFYMMKPFDEEVLRSRIHYISQKKDWKTKQRELEDLRKRQGKPRKWSMEEEVGNLVYAMGILPYVKGYFYLRDAIIMAVHNAKVLHKMTKGVYPAIAKMHGTTPASVERAIRHAIDVAWTREKTGNIKWILGQDISAEREKPTNAEVITILSDKIRLQYGGTEKDF